MLREQAQKALLGEGLTAQDAPLAASTDLSDQVAAAVTAPPLRGTTANDRLRGANDDDLIQGLAGNDTLIGRRGQDRLLGQAGDDSLNGGGGADTLIGGGGNDRLKGGGGSDNLKGGGGDDTLLGGGGADTLKGGGGEDSLNGGGGADFLAGGGKSDTLDGSRGDDTLKGGGGDDLILGGGGSDSIIGGGGADTIRYRNADFAGGAVDEIVGFRSGQDRIDLSAVSIPAEGLGFQLIDGAIALEIAGGSLVFQGVTNPAALAAADFVLPDGAAPIRFTLQMAPPPVAENRAPAITGPVESAAPETDPAFSVDLLSGASDPDEGDVLSVSDLTLVSGDASGISIAPAALEVDPTAYQRLAAGEAETIVYTYQISDGDLSVAQTATVTILGVNDAPVVANPVSAAASEDDPGFAVDLLAGAGDPDEGADLSVEAVRLVTGEDRGVVVNGAMLEVDPGAYDDLGAGAAASIVYHYDVADGLGGIASQTATITINGRNDAPTVSGGVRAGGVADGAAFSVDLLDGASDVDLGDSLTITDLRVVSGDASGVRPGESSLTVDPSVYTGLGEGQDTEIVYAYAITDGFGASVAQTATITIVGANDAPSVPVQLNAGASEDDARFTLDLLQGASDPDPADQLSVANFALVSGDPAGVVLAGNRLDIEPGAYNRLSAGEQERIVFRYDVVDGRGGTGAQVAAITITGLNDAPVAASDLRAGGSESGGDFAINLLEGASDPDEADILSAQGVTLMSGDGSGVTIGATSLSVDASAYKSLGFGDVETIRYSYQITDSAGGVIPRTAEITVIGENDAPATSGPVTAVLSELDASTTLNLLDGASDPDSGDEVSIANLRLTGGDDAGVTILADALSIDPSLYSALILGEQEVISYAYDLIDGKGGVTPQTAVVTVAGADEFRSIFDSNEGAEIEGSPDRDRIFGNGGDDTIIGGAGDDLVFGGADNDVIGTSLGKDRLSGGAGENTFFIAFADEANEVLDTTADIITDFDPLQDTLDFRKVIGPDENFADLIRVTEDASGNLTTIGILETDVLILEGISLTRQQMLGNGNFAFNSANFIFEENNLGFANLAFAGGEVSPIFLQPLEEGETYELNEASGGGFVFLDGDELNLDPSDIFLPPGTTDIVSASISHVDRFGIKATTEMSWLVRAPNQPPTITEGIITVLQTATEIVLDLNDFADDDFFTFDFSEPGPLKFAITVQPLERNGNVALDGSELTFTLGDDFRLLIEGSQFIDFEITVTDAEGERTEAPFTIIVESIPIVTAVGTELDAPITLNLLQGTSAPVVSIANLELTNGNDVGVTASGNTLTVNPDFYRSLILGEEERIVFIYDLVNEDGSVNLQTTVITIEGADDIRTVSDSDASNDIQGSPERDEIFGNGGDDTIIGGQGDDSIFGGADNDVISTSAGVDELSGGAGQDRFLLLAEDGVIDPEADIITDFDPLFDSLDFRDVLKEALNLEEFVSFQYDPVLDQTEVSILDERVVILEGVDQTFQEMLFNGNLIFHDPNFHFDESAFALVTQAIAGGPEAVIALPALEEDEIYELNSFSGGGFVFLSGEEIFLDPGDIFLGPGQTADVTASVSHFDRFGVEAKAEVIWNVLPGNQPPSFVGAFFTVAADAIDITWDLEDFAEDDFLTFDGFPSAEDLDFFVTSDPALGSVALDGSNVTFSLEGDFRDLPGGETRFVDIGFEVIDAEGESALATFVVEVQGASVPLFINSGAFFDQLLFSADFNNYEVQLQQGVEYAFQARGQDTGEGSLIDPALTLFDDNFNFLDQDDNGGVGENSLLRFTADRTGLFFLQVDASDPFGGDYVIEATQDDFADTFDEAPLIFPGDFVFGALETPGDQDVLAIDLFEGFTYQFDLFGQPSGAGTLFDPLLRLQNRFGEEIAVNDDHFDPNTGGFTLESQIVFTPTQTDTFYLVVDSFDAQSTGSWELSTFEFF